MRSIFVGIEYAGKSTLINLLAEYYHRHKLPTHWDDHFTIPDASLSPESQALMVNFPNDVKERIQRMQLQYHVEIIKKYANPLIAGWHIEEAIYSAMYGDDPISPYYDNYMSRAQRLYETQVLEAHLPDVVIIHVVASDEAIRNRMTAAPHKYQVIKEKDIPEIRRRFEEEVEKSLFTHQGRTVVLDTTERTPQESLDDLLFLTEPLITAGELAIRALSLPAGDYDAKYESGIRKMIPIDEE